MSIINWDNFDSSPEAAQLNRKLIIDNTSIIIRNTFSTLKEHIPITISVFVDPRGSYRAVPFISYESVSLMFPQLVDTFNETLDTKEKAIWALLKSTEYSVAEIVFSAGARGGVSIDGMGSGDALGLHPKEERRDLAAEVNRWVSPPEEPEGCDKTRPLSREEKFIAERLSKFRFPTKDNSETKNKGIGKDACRDLAINVIMIDSMADLKVYMMNYDLEQVFIKGNIYGNCDSRAAALEEVYERLLVVLRKAEADWNAGQSTRGYFRSTAPTGPDVFVMDALARSLRPTNPAEESSSTFGSSSAISTPTTGYSRASTVVGRSGCDKLGNMARDELREEIQKVLGELAT